MVWPIKRKSINLLISYLLIIDFFVFDLLAINLVACFYMSEINYKLNDGYVKFFRQKRATRLRGLSFD
jgi:hypothetical protein